MPDEAQPSTTEPGVTQSLLWGVRLLTVVCLGLSLTPAALVMAFEGDQAKSADAAIQLLIFSPLWVALLCALALSCTQKLQRALGIAIGASAAGFVFSGGVLATLSYMFLQDRAVEIREFCLLARQACSDASWRCA